MATPDARQTSASVALFHEQEAAGAALARAPRRAMGRSIVHAERRPWGDLLLQADGTVGVRKVPTEWRQGMRRYHASVAASAVSGAVALASLGGMLIETLPGPWLMVPFLLALAVLLGSGVWALWLRMTVVDREPPALPLSRDATAWLAMAERQPRLALDEFTPTMLLGDWGGDLVALLSRAEALVEESETSDEPEVIAGVRAVLASAAAGRSLPAAERDLDALADAARLMRDAEARLQRAMFGTLPTGDGPAAHLVEQMRNRAALAAAVAEEYETRASGGHATTTLGRP